MLAPGTVIDGRFEIVELLGEGGMGTVYAARHKNMDRTIALKLMKATLVGDEEKVARFRNEARVLSSLKHPNIIAVHAIGVADSGQPYMAMDIVAGESISDAIKRRGPFTQDEALRICVEICAGLHYAHENQIVHRDIKPSNIILSTTDGGTPVPKLVDFGIAKILDPAYAQQLTQTGVAIGSVFYLSPGQLEGRAADPASDIYALGCTLYEMLTGVAPFESDNFFETAMMHKNAELVPVNERNPSANIDESVQQIIDHMLAKEHQLRYQSADNVRLDLAAALAKQPISISKTSKAKKAKGVRSGQRASAIMTRKSLTALVLTAIIGLGASAAFYVSQHSTSYTQSKYASEVVQNAEEKLGRRSSWNSYEEGQKFLPMFLAAVKEAEASGDPLLAARAHRIAGMAGRALLLSPGRPDIKRDDWDRTCFQQFQQAIDFAQKAIYQKSDAKAMRAARMERFSDELEYASTITFINDPLTSKQWEDLLIAYRAVSDKSEFRKADFIAMSRAQVFVALSKGDVATINRTLNYRPQILDLTHVSPRTRSQECADVQTSLRELGGSEELIRRVAEKYH